MTHMETTGNRSPEREIRESTDRTDVTDPTDDCAETGGISRRISAFRNRPDLPRFIRPVRLVRSVRLSHHEKRGTVEIETAPFVVFVKDFHQEQPAGRRGVLGDRTVLRGEHLAHTRGRHPAAADFQQRADHAPHHLVEKTVAHETETHQRSELFDFQPVHRADMILVRDQFDREGGKIVLAFEQFHRIPNGVQLREIGLVMTPARGERIEVAGVDHVDIGFAFGGKPGVEIGRGIIHAPDPDVRRQQTVHGFFDLPVWDVRTFRSLERDRHALRVNAGIRAAAALDPDPFDIEEMRVI